MWTVIQLLLVLSHGQASVEHSFSINEEILLPNMKAQTLYAIKFISDTMRSQSIQPHEFKVSDRLLQYCSQSRSRYALHLVDQKTAAAAEQKKRKTMDSQEAYLQAKKKLKSLEDQPDSCAESADKLAKDSLKKQKFELLAQSVALRDKATKLQKDIEDQRKVVSELKSGIIK